MVIKKNIRAKGKISLSKYFQELKIGDKVAVKRELSINASYPPRLQGRTGIVSGKKGRIFIIDLNDQEKPKQFLIDAVHLKKINN